MSVKIKINTTEKDTEDSLIDLVDMFDHTYGSVFQQYVDGEPSNEYWINVGVHEKRLVSLWLEDESEGESNHYRLSTDNQKDLKQFREGIKALRVDAELTLTLKIKK